ncbi:MAG: DUF167 domain-containing protein [Alphaproteobacteria bacterium]
MRAAPFRIANGRLCFALRLTPKGGRNALEGWVEAADGSLQLKARVSAPPHEGAANAALVGLLARHFGVAKSKVAIVAGTSARIKRVEVEGDAALAARLPQWEKAP